MVVGFAIVAAWELVTAVGVVAFREPIRSVLSLVVVMLVAPGGVGGWVAALVNRLVIRIGTRSAESPHTAASQDDVVELGSTPGSGA